MNPGIGEIGVQAVPNWTGATVPAAEGRFKFPFWWEPVMLRFQLTTSIAVANRLTMVDLFSLENGVQFTSFLRSLVGAALAVPASTNRQIMLAPDIAETAEDATIQAIQGQLAPFVVAPDMQLRLSIVDIDAADTVQAVRLFYRRLA